MVCLKIIPLIATSFYLSAILVKGNWSNSDEFEELHESVMTTTVNYSLVTAKNNFNRNWYKELLAKYSKNYTQRFPVNNGAKYRWMNKYYNDEDFEPLISSLPERSVVCEKRILSNGSLAVDCPNNERCCYTTRCCKQYSDSNSNTSSKSSVNALWIGLPIGITVFLAKLMTVVMCCRKKDRIPVPQAV